MIRRDSLGRWSAFGAGCFFGINSAVVKLGTLQGISIINLLLTQYVCALAWFGIKSLRTSAADSSGTLRNLLRHRSHWVAGIASALTGLLYYAAIALTRPSIAALGLFQYPWILLVLAAAFDREPVTRHTLGVVALIGIGTMLTLGTTAFPLSLLGLILSVLAAGAFATYLWSLQRMTTAPRAQLLVIGIATVITASFGVTHPQLLSRLTVMSLVFGGCSALFGLILTFELLSFAARQISATAMAPWTTTELPVAVGLSWILWGPPPHVAQIVGLVLMVGSLVWLQYHEIRSLTNHPSR
jgi:drug/metabolite transporter (DMT)-like permease